MQINPKYPLKPFKKLIKYAGLTITLLVMLTGNSFGQSITWQRILNNGFGGITKVQQTIDGGYISFGSDYVNNGNVQWVTWIQKYNVLGDTVWKKIINERNFFCFWGEQTNDNGYILCGDINDNNSNSSDVYLYKTDSSGNKLWSKVLYNGNNTDQGYCVKQISSGGYIVICRVENFNTDIGIIKTDINGNIIWSKIYVNSANSQTPSEILELFNGGFIITGSISNGLNMGDVLLMRINSIGDTLWTRNFGGPNSDDGNSIDFAIGGGYIIAGSSGNSSRESYIIKTDTSGNLIWQKTYSGYSDDYTKSIRKKSTAGYIMVGSGDSINEFFGRAKIRLIDQLGNILYQNSFYPGTDENEFRTVELTSDGGFIIGGYTKNSSGKQMYIIKTDSLLRSIPIGILNPQIIVPLNFTLYQNYPNPLNPLTNIK